MDIAATTQLTLLRIDSSARHDGSVSRRITDQLVGGLIKAHPGLQVSIRDLAAETLPAVDEHWVRANNTAPEERTEQHKRTLAVSDVLIEEVMAAGILVLGVPIYNFTVPAAFKLWIDQICRARKTFRYGEAGPVGLLEGKRAYVVATSGGTPVGSAIDYATGYVRHVLGFIGIKDVEFVTVDRLMFEGEAKIKAASEKVDALLSAALADAQTAAAADVVRA